MPLLYVCLVFFRLLPKYCIFIYTHELVDTVDDISCTLLCTVLFSLPLVDWATLAQQYVLIPQQQYSVSDEGALLPLLRERQLVGFLTLGGDPHAPCTISACCLLPLAALLNCTHLLCHIWLPGSRCF